MKRIAFFLCVIFSLNTFAEIVKIGDLYYEIAKNSVCSVTQSTEPPYTGDITIPDSVTYNGKTYPVSKIGDNAFYGAQINTVKIPNTVKEIGGGAFEHTSLVTIVIPNTVKTMGESTFEYCTGLKSVTLPDSMELIPACTFKNCWSLTSIDIPDCVKEIGPCAFQYCENLKTIKLPSRLEKIGYLCFDECYEIESITIPQSVTYIGSMTFMGCKKLKTFEFPSSIEVVYNYMFDYCLSLESVTLPTSAKEIEEGAFSFCKILKEISIPKNVKKIGEHAFYNCVDLETVYCYAESVPVTKENAFEKSMPEYITLYVPDSLVQKYKETSPWNSFGTIKALEGNDPQTKRCVKPTITYDNGKLCFYSQTEGCDFISSVTCSDAGNYNTSEINLAVSYEISVYATKAGYENSETATATLCWINASPEQDGTNGTMEVPARSVLVQAFSNSISISGLEKGELIEVYSINGSIIKKTFAESDTEIINITDFRNPVIIKIEDQSIKVMAR